MKLYYRIWVDCIVKAQSIPANKHNWKWFTIAFMSLAMAINFACIMSILQRNIFGVYFYKIQVDIFPGNKLDALISGLILFVLPSVLINYFYKINNELYFLIYIILSGILCIVFPLVIHNIKEKINLFNYKEIFNFPNN